ncbi:MAG: glycosyltransferase, partial [Lachnospiraceae bacterium]|nr:glycosyltransferase [Lachnospiraceae bacterium]
LEMYPDVAKSKVDPWRHYVTQGKKEGRDNGWHPSEGMFFAKGYLEMYPDVAKSKVDPWRHYVLKGKKEGRDNGVHPGEKQFRQENYLQNYSKVIKAGTDPWKHYVLNHIGHRINYLSDYAVRLYGHEQETMRSVYLTPYKSYKYKNSKRALLIGHDLTINGAPFSLLSVAKILISDGYLVDIAVKDKNYVNEIQMYDGIGADVFLIPNSTECFPNAERIIRNYDFVIINTIVMAAYAELCKKLNVPHIWFIREDLPSIQYFFNCIKSSKERFFDDYKNILFVSKYVSDCVFNEYKIKCRYINNFIEDVYSSTELKSQTDKKVSIKERPVNFAVVGGVEKRKAQESVVAAFLYSSATYIYQGKWKLFFVGNSANPLGKKLRSVTKNMLNIVWCGNVTGSKKWELFKNIDFFIVPSLEEASSRVAIEGAMLGKPIIATTHVGAVYLTENNAGFVFEPGDAKALRDIIDRCINMSDDEYAKMSHQARLNYEKTSSMGVYHKALSGKIREAYKICCSVPSSEKHVNSSILPRSLGTGGNVISFDNLEYIKFSDLGQAGNASGKNVLFNAPKHNQMVGVVVPVFNGVNYLKVLIPSLFRNTDLPHKFVFVDDCSGAETTDYLNQAVADRDDCILMRNEVNSGFVKSVNRGASEALECCDNFVMLNSDTEVPSGWLSRLMKPIFENEQISSVTPLSNSCNIFSFPFFNNTKKNLMFLEEFGLEEINKAILNSQVDAYFRIPTGHGFCMAVSGKVWKKIGGLNEALFGRGFGEENEWSLRAELDGFQNVLTPTLFVAHHEKGTFSSEEKIKNCEAAQQIISVMFPYYHSNVRNFLREYPSADSIVAIYLSLAKQKGYKTELFTDSSKFEKRLSGADGIFVIISCGVTKIAIKLLGQVIFVANAKNLDETDLLCKTE